MIVLIVAWYRSGRLRRTVFRLFLVFLLLAKTIRLVWCSMHSSPMNYNMAFKGSDTLAGGLYFYPVLTAWFVAGFLILLHELPGDADGSKGAPSRIELRLISPRAFRGQSLTGSVEVPAAEQKNSR